MVIFYRLHQGVQILSLDPVSKQAFNTVCDNFLIPCHQLFVIAAHPQAFVLSLLRQDRFGLCSGILYIKICRQN